MEKKLQIPDYMSIKDWKYFDSLELDSDFDRMINFISYISNTDIDELKSWTPGELTEAYTAILDALGEISPKFFPLIEIEGKLYGYSAISKMTIGEYIDLERLSKKPQENLEEIMAILYRPVTKHKFKSLKWAFKSKYKVGIGEVEDPLKYYDIEPYNSNDRIAQAEIMQNLPVSFATGALNFFLALASTSLLSSQISSLQNPKDMKKTVKKIAEQVSTPIGDGLLQFITSRKLPSLQSQGIRVSQI
jgi:hypothetical protein